MDAEKLPFFHAYDADQRRLTLRGADHIAPEVVTFLGEHKVRILDANDGHLSTLPDSFATLQDLEIAFFSNNHFTAVPDMLARTHLKMLAFKSNQLSSLGALPLSLRWLMATNNKIETVDASIGQLAGLEKVALAGNLLRGLPEAMQHCRKLGLLRLSANAFDTPPPAWLFDMPNLAWYSDGGNTFAPQARADFTLASVHWDELSITHKINESPSSLVYGATLPNGERVAAKLFKGGMSSDGYLEDDMRAFLAVGQHDHLLNIRAKLHGAPDGRQGFALTLVPPDYKQLGNVPDFESCTRDTYPAGKTFDRDFVLQTLRGIASAATHLHARGMMHGDLYAHNILARDDGHALLCDFGAASFYDTHVQQRERMDVKAFGFLMDDMMTRMKGDAGDLVFLRDVCLSANVAVRPSFTAIAQRLIL